MITKQLDQTSKIFHMYVNCGVPNKLLVSKITYHTKYSRLVSAVALHSTNHRQKYIHRQTLTAGYSSGKLKTVCTSPCRPGQLHINAMYYEKGVSVYNNEYIPESM